MFAETKHYFEYSKAEKDYEALLRVAKEKYEQRLEAITDKVRMIYEEIRHDEVLATMREDPTSNAYAGQRVFEICEDNLAIEREETIEKLMAEVAALSSNTARLDKEVNVLRAALLKAEEINEGKNKGEEEKSALLKVNLEEVEKLRGILEEKECALWKKTTDYEVLLHELQNEKKNKQGTDKQEYKTKSSRLKKKIIEQKATIVKMDNELSSAKEALDSTKANYEKSLQQVQDDLTRVRDTWEERCREMQVEHNSKVSGLQSSHQQQLRDLQSHYQQLLEDKLTEFQSETNNHITRQKQLDTELAQKVDERIRDMQRDYISKTQHSQLLTEAVSGLKSEHAKSLSEIEEQHAHAYQLKLKDMRDNFRLQQEKLSEKVSQLDEERTKALMTKRQAEADLEFSSQKIETLNLRINSLNQDINHLENSKRNLLQNIEETSLTLAKVRASYEEEAIRRQRVESELEQEKQKSRDNELTFQELASKYNLQKEEISHFENSLLQEQRKTQALASEHEKVFPLKEALEREASQAKEQLGNAQKELKGLNKEFQKSQDECERARSKASNLESEVIELKKQISALRNISNDSESEMNDLRKQCLKSKNLLREVKFQAKDSISKLRSELKQASRKSTQELGNFRHAFIEEVGDAFSSFQRSTSSKDKKIQQKQQEIQSLSKMLKDSQDTLNLSIQEQAQYEATTKSLKETIANLKKETQIKNQEISKFSDNLREFQEMRKKLERENQRLEAELSSAHNEIESIRQESIDIQQEVYENSRHKNAAFGLRDQLDALEYKANGIMEQLQSELEPLHQSMADEKLRYQKLRAEKNAEIDLLRNELKKANGELMMKNDIIERLESEKDGARRIEQRGENQQLQELKGKLAQSYHSTLETVRQAKELEKETLQLTLQAKESGDLRKSNISLSQLKASLEKYAD